MTRSVLEKLGWKMGMTGYVHNRPAELTDLVPLPGEPPVAQPDLVIAFVARTAEMNAALAVVRPLYLRGNKLWFCYPKAGGALRTDLNRDRGWEPLDLADLLPVSQVSIDATWSALRFRYRDEIPKLTRRF